MAHGCNQNRPCRHIQGTFFQAIRRNNMARGGVVWKQLEVGKKSFFKMKNRYLLAPQRLANNKQQKVGDDYTLHKRQLFIKEF